MTLNRVKLGCTVTFMKYLASVVFLIYLAKTLIWYKTTFTALNSLNLAVLVVNEPMKSIYKKITNILLYIRFIIALCKDFKSL